jgi:hexosaminidase
MLIKGTRMQEAYCGEPPCGQLDPTLPATYALVDAVVREVADLFPDACMHLGADEVNYK